MQFDFLDTRTNVMGARFRLNAMAFITARRVCEVPKNVRMDLVLTDLATDEEGSPSKHPGTIIAEEDLRVRLHIPVSDRLEFTPKAVTRVNRNLYHLFRHVAQYYNLRQFYGESAADFLVTQDEALLQVNEMDALGAERHYRDTPELKPVLIPAETGALSPESANLLTAEERNDD